MFFLLNFSSRDVFVVSFSFLLSSFVVEKTFLLVLFSFIFLSRVSLLTLCVTFVLLVAFVFVFLSLRLIFIFIDRLDAGRYRACCWLRM